LKEIFNQKSNLSDGVTKGTELQTISASELSNTGNSPNYTYSLWFYIDEWNYKFGQTKTLLARLDENNEPSPSITLGAMENDVHISIACYPTSGSSEVSNIHNCKIKNIPLQKWVNLIVSLHGQTLDVYVDGKLHKTCVMNGVAKINPDANVSITPDGGFNGWSANFKYWNSSTNPQQAYNIYKEGYGGSGIFGNIFNKYKLRVQFIQDNEVGSSFEI
jgi:hypothetical protein